MTRNERENFKYLDSILKAIKNGGDNITFHELANILEYDNLSDIKMTLVSGASPILEKALVYLRDKDFIKVNPALHKDDSQSISLKYPAEIILEQGGLLQDAIQKEKDKNRVSRFHSLMPLFSGLAFFVGLSSLIWSVFQSTQISNSNERLESIESSISLNTETIKVNSQSILENNEAVKKSFELLKTDSLNISTTQK